MTETLRDSIANNDAQDEASEIEGHLEQYKDNLNVIIKRVMAAYEHEGMKLTAEDYQCLLSLNARQRLLIVQTLNSDIRYTTYTDRD